MKPVGWRQRTLVVVIAAISSAVVLDRLILTPTHQVSSLSPRTKGSYYSRQSFADIAFDQVQQSTSEGSVIQDGNSSTTQAVQHHLDVQPSEISELASEHKDDSAGIDADDHKSNSTNGETTPITPPLVLLMCYFRGGSSFLGEMLGRYPGSFYHFEALRPIFHHIYGSRPEPSMLTEPTDRSFFMQNGSFIPRPSLEKNLVAEAVHSILTCDMSHLPVEYFLDSFLHQQLPVLKFRDCMVGVDRRYRNCEKHASKKSCFGMPLHCAEAMQQARLCRDSFKQGLQADNSSTRVCRDPKWLKDNVGFIDTMRCLDDMYTQKVASCVPHLQDACQMAPLRSIKVIRLASDHLQDILRHIPQLKVVHLLRDPRAVLRSESDFRGGKKRNLRLDVWKSRAQHLCTRMRRDIEEIKRLSQFHTGTFLSLRFEDLATSAIDTAQTIYSHVNMDLHQEVIEWIHGSTHANKDAKGLIGTRRTNSTQEAYDWQDVLTHEQLTVVNNVEDCQYVLKQMNYVIKT